MMVAGKVRVEYTGKRAPLTIKMPWLKGGPYTFPAGERAAEMLNEDADRLLKENPTGFKIVGYVPQKMSVPVEPTTITVSVPKDKEKRDKGDPTLVETVETEEQNIILGEERNELMSLEELLQWTKQELLNYARVRHQLKINPQNSKTFIANKVKDLIDRAAIGDASHEE